MSNENTNNETANETEPMSGGEQQFVAFMVNEERFKFGHMCMHEGTRTAHCRS